MLHFFLLLSFCMGRILISFEPHKKTPRFTFHWFSEKLETCPVFMLLISYECLSRNQVFKIRWDHNNIKEKNPFLLSYVFLSQHVCDRISSFLKTNSRNAFCERYTATVAGSSCISSHCAGNVNITHIFSFYLNLFKHLISPGK